MNIHLTTEQEARLAELAARDGRNPHDLAAEAVMRYLDGEAHFAGAVARGLAAAERGEFVAPDEVWTRVERILKT